MKPTLEASVFQPRAESVQHTATRRNTLQHAAPHCNTPQHTATRRNTLQHAATHCNTPQQAATRRNTLQHAATYTNTHYRNRAVENVTGHMFHTFGDALQRTATHCNTLQQTATTHTAATARWKISLSFVPHKILDIGSPIFFDSNPADALPSAPLLFFRGWGGEGGVNIIPFFTSNVADAFSSATLFLGGGMGGGVE